MSESIDHFSLDLIVDGILTERALLRVELPHASEPRSSVIRQELDACASLLRRARRLKLAAV